MKICQNMFSDFFSVLHRPMQYIGSLNISRSYLYGMLIKYGMEIYFVKTHVRSYPSTCGFCVFNMLDQWRGT